jgi:hypothetical protein
MRIKIPDNAPACDYTLLGNVFDVDAVQTVDEKDEYKGPIVPPLDPKSKEYASQSNWAIKIIADDQLSIPPQGDYFALFYVPPDHANDPAITNYIQSMKEQHGLRLGWLYKIIPNSFVKSQGPKGSAGFQVEPVFKSTGGDPSPYVQYAAAVGLAETDPQYYTYMYDQGYKQLNELQKKKPTQGWQGRFKIVLIPRRIVLMPLYFKPDSMFVQRSGNALELQLAPDKECFAIVAGVKPGALFHSSIISQIQHVRDALIKHFKLQGFASHDVAIDPLAIFSFCSNKITDPDVCRMLLLCCEEIAAVLGCRKKSRRIQDGLLYTHPDQINILWKLYGIGLAIEAFNRLVHSSKSFTHTLHNISQQEVIDLALKIHFVERVGSIFEIQQRVLLQCFDVMDVHRRPEQAVCEEADPFREENRAENLLIFLACIKREVFEPGVVQKDDGKIFRMPQNICRVIRKLLRMTPPFHKAKCHQLISEVVFSASTSLSLITRFIKQFTAFGNSNPEKPPPNYEKRQQQFSLLKQNSNDVNYVEASSCIFEQVRSWEVNIIILFWPLIHLTVRPSGF